MQFASLHFIENVIYSSESIAEKTTTTECMGPTHTHTHSLYQLIRLRKSEIQYVLTVENMNNEHTLKASGWR